MSGKFDVIEKDTPMSGVKVILLMANEFKAEKFSLLTLPSMIS